MSGKTTLTLLVLATIAVAVAFAFGPAGTPAAQGQEDAKYVGSKKCTMCHADQVTTWEKMKHSRAWDSLTAEQVASGKDDQGRACVQCHVTGMGKPGGSTSADATPDMKNVGCESCHGAGSVHMKTMMMAAMEDSKPENKHISMNVGCTECHNPHISYKELYGK